MGIQCAAWRYGGAGVEVAAVLGFLLPPDRQSDQDGHLPVSDAQRKMDQKNTGCQSLSGEVRWILFDQEKQKIVRNLKEKEKCKNLTLKFCYNSPYQFRHIYIYIILLVRYNIINH